MRRDIDRRRARQESLLGMNLLFLSNVFPNPYQPTKGVFNQEMLRAFARAHEVRVISPVSWVDEWRARGGAREPLDGGRRRRTAGLDVYYPRYYYPPKVLRPLYDRFLWYSVRAAVRQALASFRPDAVLGYWAHPDGAVAVRIARGLGVPAAVMVGGSDVLLLGRDPWRRRSILRVVRQADVVLTASQDLKTKVEEQGVDPARVHVVYRGVDTSRFCPGDRRQARRRLGLPVEGRVLLWVGRMVPVKGLDVLLDAAGRLTRDGVAFRLHLVGDGPLRAGLERRCREDGLAGVVSFAGAVGHAQLPDWYRAADLTVLPSRSEGVPNVLRESLACGTPFVASRVGGIPEVAGGRQDWLVRPEDAAALAAALVRVLREGDGPRELPRPSGDWEQSAEALVAVLRALVPAPPDGVPA
jgi:glycosyltransferase involved in cell wall biosynthesis